MPDTNRIEIRHGADGRYEIHFDYNEELLAIVRALPGRQFDWDGKYWSIPEASLVLAVSALEAFGVGLDTESREAHEKLTKTDSPGSKKAHAKDLTVWELNRAVAKAIAGRFPSEIWVVGEVAGLKEVGQRGNTFFELVDMAPDGTIRAKVNMVIWENAWEQIEQAIGRSGIPFELENGLSIRVAIKVELFERDGKYRPSIQSIDPNYTLGEITRRRELVIRELAKQGLLDSNTSITLPSLPLRVALITSVASNARRDFEQRLLNSGFGFSLSVLDVRMQGPQSERMILKALRWCDLNSQEFDVVALCRGGGSPTDLMWLDTLQLGQAVARLSLPLVVGIGHETDSTVLDSVARSFSTPNACADNLVAVVRKAVDAVGEQRNRLLRKAAEILQDERERWQKLIRAIRFLAPQILRRHRSSHLQVARSIGIATAQTPHSEQVSESSATPLTRTPSSACAGQGLRLTQAGHWASG
jgi:exodeoxyribonuclease VII large subunit